jgi:hypothetical protein|tara:strand:+ start:834 stop:1205 length:372 start_codon:yes stop_codon:yes gene_type:complete
MATNTIVDKDGNSIAYDDATVPSDRHFRDAWSLSGSIITEDVAVSKVIFKDKIREVRTPLLDAEDIVYMRALEVADAPAQAASIAVKKALRDAPAASAIADAATITNLKAAWDTDVLGDSPYA